ncbi:hypothetical protein [Stygiolobus caldivivus]|nr:hypothetical protein [Stygiolobus caldivivus]
MDNKSGQLDVKCLGALKAQRYNGSSSTAKPDAVTRFLSSTWLGNLTS